MNGRVSLVGAGPGDPELLTLKAFRLLRSADAVLYDELVSPEILKLASPAAQLHNVGKRCGKKKIQQEQVNFLMIGLAESGLHVVRLKSGDPMIFGRAGEEIEVLRKANVEYEIVPGVTSALGAAATAQIPLTHRGESSAVIFITAHQASNSEAADWNKLAGSGATLVIYMPGHEYGQIAAKLKTAGLASETPCAIVSRATTPEQRTFRTRVGDLQLSPRLPAPSLLVVGDVVRLAEQFELAPTDAEVSIPAELISALRTKSIPEEPVA